jgi:hypothetical protein
MQFDDGGALAAVQAVGGAEGDAVTDTSALECNKLTRGGPDQQRCRW